MTVQPSRKNVALSAATVFVTTSTVSVLWHSFLFPQEFEALGVFTRMNEPIYGFGVGAWLVESAAFVLVFSRTEWSKRGIVGGLRFGWLMALFSSAASVFGVAAKTRVAGLGLWFLLSGGFLLLNFTLMGIAAAIPFRLASTNRAVQREPSSATHSRSSR